MEGSSRCEGFSAYNTCKVQMIRSRCKVQVASISARLTGAANGVDTRKGQRVSAAAQAPPLPPTHDVESTLVPEELVRFRSSFRSNTTERALFVPANAIKGKVPTSLKGTLLRNGPANFNFGGAHLENPLAGDGAVTALAFWEGSIFMRRRFARTRALREEMEAGRQLYKELHSVGDSGAPFSWPFDIKLRQPANSAVVHWAGKILALYERDLPYVMDTALNSTSKESSSLNVWNDGDVMASHYRVTVEQDGSKRLCTWGALESGLDLVVKILELDEAGNKVTETKHTMQGAALTFIHDMLVTENYYILTENPTRMNFWKLASDHTFGKAALAECLHADGALPMKIHCIPRPGKEGRTRITYETQNSLFSMHHANAWEYDSSTIVVDTLARDTAHFAASDVTHMNSFEGPENATTLRRLVMRGSAVHCREYNTRSVAGIEGRSLNFPSVLPPECTGRSGGSKAVFAVASRGQSDGSNGLGQCIVRINMPVEAGVSQEWNASAVTVQEYCPGAMRYCGEPVFVPKADAKVGDAFPGNGYILVHVNDLREEGRERTFLEILDASDIAAGPLATIDLQELIHSTHGCWTDAYLGSTPNETIPMNNDIRYCL